MNYANMIEEKNLKKTFIVATLCSTLVGTFTSSIGLWDRVQERRHQGKRDKTQDEELNKLRERVEKAEKRADERQQPRRGARDDEVGDNFERSSALIQRQFDEGFGRLGNRFAQGDTLTENQLQRQIIALQQTVIQVLQDALANDRQLTRADMAKLVSASNAAREGSIEALRDQQQRLAPEEAIPTRHLALEDSVPSPQRALAAPKRAPTVIESDELFCRYSLDLQYQAKKPLSASFAPGGDCRCPDCDQRLDVTADDFWAIGKRTPVLVREGGYEKEVMETREFHLGQRFVIKCHTADGEFACVLCSKFRERDAICRTVESLVNHVGRFHEVDELERDRDLRETLPMPVGKGSGSVVGSAVGSGVVARELEVRNYR